VFKDMTPHLAHQREQLEAELAQQQDAEKQDQ
jgi:hypothetical protein